MKFLLICFTFLFSGIIDTVPIEWILRKEKGKIKVYTREGANSKIKELKITMRFQADVKSVVAVLDDVKTHPEWVYKCSEAKRLDIASEYGYYYYVAVDFPFPAIDRDVVIFTRKEQNKLTKAVTTFSVATPDEYPEQEGFIRIKHFNSTYRIIPNDDGSLTVEYEMFTDPGGNIPTWMINLAIAKGPINTMQNLEIQAQKDKYTDVFMEGVD